MGYKAYIFEVVVIVLFVFGIYTAASVILSSNIKLSRKKRHDKAVLITFIISFTSAVITFIIGVL